MHQQLCSCSAQGVLRQPPLGLRIVANLLQGCTSAMFFEARKRKDCYLWLSKVPSGPTAKFLIVNGASAAPAAMASCSMCTDLPTLQRSNSKHGLQWCWSAD